MSTSRIINDVISKELVLPNSLNTVFKNLVDFHKSTIFDCVNCKGQQYLIIQNTNLQILAER